MTYDPEADAHGSYAEAIAEIGRRVCAGEKPHPMFRPARKPLAVDLFCGLGGWAEGLMAEGWEVIGFDIERHVYGEHRYPAHLVLQDALTLHGSQFRDADLIVASPPCQFFSYTAMPWRRAKALAAEVRADPARLATELALFEACFRIQREAREAAGRHIPLIVENVRGAQKWVGQAQANYGSFYLWGDVPIPQPGLFGDEPRQSLLGYEAVMKYGKICHSPEDWKRVRAGDDIPHPHKIGGGAKVEGIGWTGFAATGASWRNREVAADHIKVRSFRFDGSGGSFQSAAVRRTAIGNGARFTSRDCGIESRWFGENDHPLRQRKTASALIAKIPLALGLHIGRVFYPR